MFQKKGFKPILIILATALVLYACNRFYKAVQIDENAVSQKTIDSLQNQNRYFILRSGSQAYYMNRIALDSNRTSLTCRLDSLPPHHQLHLTRGRNGNLRYISAKGDDAVLNEVHFYIPADTLSSGPYVLNLEKVKKIEVIEKDRKRTTNSYVLGGLGYAAGSMLLAGVIIAATKSSCPFVSAYTNNEFLLQGEIYGGAIYPQLARDDYMPLKIQPLRDGTLQVKISNELQERQFTDCADLFVITHKPDSRILADEKGNLYEISDPQGPATAWAANGENVLDAITQNNDNSLLHFDDTTAAGKKNYMVAKFNKPASATKGKLVISLKNSYWLDYLYGEMSKNFGSYYPVFIRKQFKTPAATLLQWSKDQKIPLEISIKTKKGWQPVMDVTTIGPVATREMVVPVNLEAIDEGAIELKFNSGFMFWEIDYVAMDYSENPNFEVQKLTPSTAVDEKGKSVLGLLKEKDGIYLEQPAPGNCVTLRYACQPDATSGRSYILHTKGYYLKVRDFKGIPNIAFLKQFKKPGRFPSYSLDMYKKYGNTIMESLVRN